MRSAQCEIENQRERKKKKSRENIAAMFALMKIREIDFTFSRRFRGNERTEDVLDNRGYYNQQH